jgi:RNA polymerase sigma-70 factor (ECF subfamily)
LGPDRLSDLDLMELFRAGQTEAFSALVHRHQTSLLTFFLRLGADFHGAEDCAQETFLRLFRYRRDYRPSAPFRAFLFRLARHSWVDWYRRTGRRETGNLEGLELTGGTVLAGRVLAGRVDASLDLKAALRALPEHLRWVIVLSTEEGLGYAEIGAVLGIPVGTVKSRMFHAMRKLRETLHVKMAR